MMNLMVQYILTHTNILEDNIRDHWAVKRPQDDFSRANGSHASMSFEPQTLVEVLYSISQPSCAHPCCDADSDTEFQKVSFGLLCAAVKLERLVEILTYQQCQENQWKRCG